MKNRLLCKVILFLHLLIAPLWLKAQANNVIIEGKIKNFEKYYDKDSYILVSVNVLAFNDRVNYSEKIKPDGTFSISFPLGHPNDIMFEYRKIITTLFVSPGDKTHIEFDADDINSTIVFSGDGARINTDIKKYLSQKNAASTDNGHDDFLKLSAAQKDSMPDAYKRFIYKRLKKDSIFYEGFISKNKVTDEFRTWGKWQILYQCADDLMRYGWLKKVNKNPYLIPESYFDFFSRFSLNNPEAAISSNYGSYLSEYNLYLTANFNDSQFKANIQLPDIAKALLDAPGLTKKQKRMLTKLSIRDSSSLSIWDIFRMSSIKKLTEKNEDLINNKLQYKAFTPLIDLYISKTEGFTRDVLLSNFFYSVIEAKDIEAIKPYMDKYKQTVHTEYLKNEILAYYQREAKNFTSYSLPKDANLLTTPQTDDVFNNIISKYKGKVVYLDFWATWCGPCREEMSYSKILREKFKNKDVVFVYLCAQSPANSWKATIAQLDIQGENYLLKNDDYKVLESKFQINGIPHYVLIDKQGKVKDANAKNPIDTTLEKEIDEIMLE